MYGISRALTTNPARSWLRITFLPSTSVAKRVGARRSVSGDVSRLVTSSTRRSTGTGLKKWMPMTCSGRLVAMPSFMIGIELVLLARIACRVGDDLVERAEHVDLRRLVLDHRLDDELAVGELAEVGGERGRGRAPRRARPRSSLPERTPRSSDVVSRCWPASAAPASTSRTTTSSPARAHTSAMPEPIRPLPTTPTRSMSLIGRGWYRSPAGARRRLARHGDDGRMGDSLPRRRHGRCRTASTRGGWPTACTTCSGRAGRSRRSARSSRRRRCSSSPRPTARAARSARTRAGRPGSCGCSAPMELCFPNYDGNGMYLSMGNMRREPGASGCCSSTSTEPNRVRVSGRATISDDPTSSARYPGAQFVVRVAVDEVFPNCPRYIHRMDVAASRRCSCPPPTARRRSPTGSACRGHATCSPPTTRPVAELSAADVPRPRRDGRRRRAARRTRPSTPTVRDVVRPTPSTDARRRRHGADGDRRTATTTTTDAVTPLAADPFTARCLRRRPRRARRPCCGPGSPATSPDEVEVAWELADDDDFADRHGHRHGHGVGRRRPQRARRRRARRAGRGTASAPAGSPARPAGPRRPPPAPTLRLAAASCQHCETGFYAAHRDIAEWAPDLVVFLGDFIYEGAAAPGRRRAGAGPRRRRADRPRRLPGALRAVPADPDLQASRAACPWCVDLGRPRGREQLRRAGPAGPRRAGDVRRPPRRRLPGVVGAHAGAPAAARSTATTTPIYRGRAAAATSSTSSCSTAASSAATRRAATPRCRPTRRARRRSTRPARCSATPRSSGSPTRSPRRRRRGPCSASRPCSPTCACPTGRSSTTTSGTATRRPATGCSPRRAGGRAARRAHRRHPPRRRRPACPGSAPSS